MKPGIKTSWSVVLLALVVSCNPANEGPHSEVGVQRESVVANFATGTLIVPMDTTYQNNGMLKAYGLVYALLKAGVPVRWAVKSAKTAQGVDFSATGRDIVSMAVITNHMYRGGPFVIDSADAAAARPIINAWQITNPTVRVHEATTGFSADITEVLRAAPRVGVFTDEFELIAFNVLNAAGITDSAGLAWPTASASNYPGRVDILNASQVAGASSGSGTDGALLRGDGTPAFHFLISMHYDSPSSEVVREVRQWLNATPLAHAYMQCSAVTAFENNANGRFLTTQGVGQETDTVCLLILCSTTTRDAPNPVTNRFADDLFNQYDGQFTVDVGALQSMGLANGSALRNGVKVLLAGNATGSNRMAYVRGNLDGNTAKGQVSYLVGHDYSTALPITTNPLTNGARVLLNSLLASSVTTLAAQPNLALTVMGPAITSASAVTWTINYTNTGAGVAEAAVITDALPAGTTFVSANSGGTHNAGTVTWQLGTIAPGETGSVTVTVAIPADGSYSNQATLNYRIGVTPRTLTSSPFVTVRDATPPDTVLATTPPVITNLTTGTFTFTSSETNSTFECSLDGAAFATCASPQNLSSLSEGPHTFRVRSVDAAGNFDPTPAAFTWTVDTTAPAAPTISAPAMGDTTTGTPTISGLAEPGASVAVTVGSTLVGTVTADATTGAWSYTLTAGQALPNGAYVASVRATDAATNQSPATTRGFTVDTAVPPSPLITAPINGSSTNDNTPLVTGTAQPGSNVQVLADGVPVGTVVTTAGGAWQYQFTVGQALADGPHAISARQQSTSTPAFSAPTVANVTVDTLAPAAPVITAPTSGQAVNTSSPVVSGTSEAFATISVSVDGGAAITTTANATGAWSVTLSGIAAGAHNVVASADDAAGNSGPDSAPRPFTVDLTAPPAPVVVTPTNGQASNDTTPTISGTAEAGSTVQIFVDNALVTSVPADGSGNWTFTPTTPLTEGAHQITTRAVDPAGNQSPSSMPVVVIIDTTAPAAPVITSPTAGSTTASGTPTVSGTSEAGATVTITIDGMTAGTVTADASGVWSLTPGTTLTEGAHSVSAVATDPAGNTGAPTTPVNFSVDTIAPMAPVITSPASGSITSNKPTFAGTAEPGSLVSIILDSATAATVLADTNGDWLYVPGAPIPDGMHTVTAVATDRAGNQSSQTTPAINFTSSSGTTDGGVDDGGTGGGGGNDDGGTGGGSGGGGGGNDGGTGGGGGNDGGTGGGTGGGGNDDGGTGGGMGGGTGGGATGGGTGGGSTGGGSGNDGGADAGVSFEYVGGGCGCSSVSPDSALYALLGLAALARRRRKH